MRIGGRGALRAVLVASAFLWVVLGFLLALLILLPTSNPTLWFFSVVASETSLLLAAFALVGLVLAGSIRLVRVRRIFLVAAALSLATLIISLVPAARALGGASEAGASVSFSEYFAGLATNEGRSPETVVYNRVDQQELSLDAWEPSGRSNEQETTGGRPAVVLVHGGSWEDGTRSEAPRWDAWLNEQGYVVFDIEYRLAPPPRWQDAPGDVKCAVGWVKDNADSYSVDPDRVALMGSSAGGHLALLAAYADDSQVPPSCEVDDTDVRAVAGLSAPTDLERLHDMDPPWYRPGVGGFESLYSFVGGKPATVAGRYQAASPVVHVSPDDPPTLLAHGTGDQIVPPEQAQLLEKRLAEANVGHRLVELPGTDHLFEFNWGGLGSQVTRHTLDEFLERHLKEPSRPATSWRERSIEQ